MKSLQGLTLIIYDWLCILRSPLEEVSVISSCMALKPKAAEASVLSCTAESPDEHSYTKAVFSGQCYCDWLFKKHEKTV